MKKKTAEENNTDRTNPISTDIFSRRYLITALLILLAVFLYMVRMFIMPVVLAAVFAGLFFPLYRRVRIWFKGKSSLASLVVCVVLLAGLLLPVYFIANMVAREAISLYETSEETIQQIIEQGEHGPLGRLQNTPLKNYVNFDDIDWQSRITDVVQFSGNLIARIVQKTYQSTFQFVANLFIVLFTMFYFFRDGEKLVHRIKYLSPLHEEHEDNLISRFMSVSRATVKGSLFLGLIQGSMGALTMWIFGVKSPILWGVVMVILSVIPMVGAWLVLYPAAIIKIIVGDVWSGIAMILITSIVIGNVDNLLRPRLVGKDAGMHDLMIFFSTLGGIAMFGIMGFILGPIVAAMTLTVLDIYSVEFKQQLDRSHANMLKNQQEEMENELPHTRQDNTDGSGDE